MTEQDFQKPMNMVKEGIQKKKSKINKIDNGLTLLQDALEKLGQSNKL